MKLICPTYSFRGAMFAVVVDTLTAMSWLVTIFTLGWIGKDWSYKLTLYQFGHPWNVVYDANYEEEPEQESEDTVEE
jgi:hypothetical protein